MSVYTVRFSRDRESRTTPRRRTILRWYRALKRRQKNSTWTLSMHKKAS